MTNSLTLLQLGTQCCHWQEAGSILWLSCPQGHPSWIIVDGKERGHHPHIYTIGATSPTLMPSSTSVLPPLGSPLAVQARYRASTLECCSCWSTQASSPTLLREERATCQPLPRLHHGRQGYIQLFCAIALRAGLPVFPPSWSTLLCCPDKVQGSLSRVKQLVEGTVAPPWPCGQLSWLA